MRNDTKYKLLKSVIQEKVVGKRGPGRKRISWLRTWFSKTTAELFRAAVNEIIIARIVANNRNEYALEEEEEDTKFRSVSFTDFFGLYYYSVIIYQ